MPARIASARRWALPSSMTLAPVCHSQPAAVQRYTTELRSYAPIGRIGGNLLGSDPMMFVVGLSAKAGAVFGSTGPFFYSQAFSLGGTQYGEQLRGYDEFSITPNGFNPNADQTQASISSFGNAFFVG